MFIRREEAERAITDYLNERAQQAGEPERQILNPAIAKLILDDIQNIRAIEVRPKANWITKEGRTWIECSHCRGMTSGIGIGYKYCPKCGAEMENE